MILVLAPSLTFLLSALPFQGEQPASKQATTRPAQPTAQEKPDELVNPRSFEKEGKLEEAIAAWRTWARLKPKDPLPYIEILRISMLQDKPLLGIRFGEQGQEKFPKDLHLMMAMATAHMRLAELVAGGADHGLDVRTILEEAEYQAEGALELSPRLRAALAVLGMAQFRLGRSEDATATAKTLSKEYPRHHGGPFLLGEIAYRQYAMARQDRGAEPKELFRLQGEARQGFMDASLRAPKKALIYRRLGDLAWLSGKRAECLKWFAEALARDPRRGAPLDWIDREIEPFERMNLYVKAAKKFAEHKTQPAMDRALLIQKAAGAAYLVGNLKLCKTLSEEGYKLDPEWKDGLYYFAITSYQLGNMEEALTAMGLYALEAPEKLDATFAGGSREQGRDLADKLVRLARMGYRKGQLLASRAINRALAKYLDDAKSWNNYAFLCRETQAYEDSYKAYERALANSPKDPRLLNDAAVILQYHLHRDIKKARGMYEEAILQAKRLLRDRSTSKERKQDARQAISDAKGNLKLLKKK